jgi:hypothetical protein
VGRRYVKKPDVPAGRLIVTGSAFANVHRETIVTPVARHKLPAIHWLRFFIAGGGLISYEPDIVDPNRRAACYVDRILKRKKPADRQAPTCARPCRRGDRVRRRRVHRRSWWLGAGTGIARPN